MLTVIIGGSGSGKSAYAENYLQQIANGCPLYYLATMQVYDQKDMKIVDRHRKLRKGKGFQTIEQPREIEKALLSMNLRKESSQKPAVLLECMSNLAANEMFSGESINSRRTVVERILSGIGILRNQCQHLVIVTGTVGEDGILYDDTTMEYVKAMGELNTALAAVADEVIEVVVGIPVVVKSADG